MAAETAGAESGGPGGSAVSGAAPLHASAAARAAAAAIAAACAFSCQPVLAAQDAATDVPRAEANHPLVGYVAAGLVLGGVYVIGKQNHGEKVLGAAYLLAVGQSHSMPTEVAGAGLAMSAYNFFYLSRGDVSNARVARDNVIGMAAVIGLAVLAVNRRKSTTETSREARTFVTLDPATRGLIAGLQRAF